MQFISAHPHMLLCAVLLAAVFVLARPLWDRADAALESLASRRWFLPSAAAALFVFLCAMYFSRPVYYTPYVGGTLGDNYNYVQHAVEDPGYFTSQHMFFPTVPGKIFHGLKRAGFFSEDDPLYLEKAFAFFSLPIRLAALAGSVALFLLLGRAGLSPVQRVVSVFFLITTFGFWFWSLQSNAMGFLLSMQLAAFYATVRAVQTGRRPWFVAAALGASFCFYTHISSVYVVAAMAGVVLFACLRPRSEGQDKRWACLASYAGVAGLLAGFHYIFMALHYGVWDIGRLFATVSDHGMFGKFGLGLPFLRRLVQDGVSTNLSVLLGLIQSEEKTRLESVVIVVQLAALLSFLWRLRDVDLRSLGRFRGNEVFWTGAACFVLCLMGFSARKTWPQYYVAILPSAVLFLASSVLNPRRAAGRRAPVSILLLLAACGLFINGFGSKNVFEGEKLESHSFYRTLRALRQAVPQGPIVFYGDSRTYEYNFTSMMHYYEMSPAYRDILWLPPAAFNQGRPGKSAGAAVVLDGRDFPGAASIGAPVTSTAELPLYRLPPASSPRP